MGDDLDDFKEWKEEQLIESTKKEQVKTRSQNKKQDNYNKIKGIRQWNV